MRLVDHNDDVEADRTDHRHHARLELLETASGPLVTTAMVVAEAVYLLTRELGPHAHTTFHDAIIDGTLTVNPSPQPTGNASAISSTATRTCPSAEPTPR